MRNITMKLLAATASLVLLGFSAQAADLPMEPVPEAPAYVPEYDWSGFYVGVHAGYGLGGRW